MHLLRLIKTNSAKISASSLINSIGMSVFFCCLISLQHFNLFQNIYFFNKEGIKIRFKSTFFFDCNNTRTGPTLHNSFNYWITNVFRCLVNLIKLLNVKMGFDIRKELIQNFGSFFITPYNFITLDNPYFLIRDIFV